MTEATAAGAIIMPPVPAFHTRPKSVADIVDHTVHRTLDLFGLAPPDASRWTGER